MKGELGKVLVGSMVVLLAVGGCIFGRSGGGPAPTIAAADRVALAKQVGKLTFRRLAKVDRWEYRMVTPTAWPLDWIGSAWLDEPEYRIGGKWHPVPENDFSRNCEITSPLNGANSCWILVPKAAERLRVTATYDTMAVGERDFTVVPLLVKPVEFRVTK
jgi:hypothetical protein